MFLRVSLLLTTLVACLNLQLSEVVAKSTRQEVERRVGGDIRDSALNELHKSASAGYGQQQRSGNGPDWKGEDKKWHVSDNNDDEEELVEAEHELDEAAGGGVAEYKRRFDSLGGGLVPIKRQQYDGEYAKRTFDSLGGGLIPTYKRRSAAASSVGKARRAFDSLGGGYVPIKRRRYA